MSTINLKINNQLKHIADPGAVTPKYNNAQKEKIAHAAKEFESLLTSMMLKSMTKTTGGMFGGDSLGGDFFDTMFQNKIASFISDKKSLGIAQILYKKITGQDMSALTDMQPPDIIKAGTITKPAGNSVPSLVPSSQAMDRLSKYQDFINEAAGTYGVDPNLIKSVILTESAANERAQSGAKAKGLMQLIDSTAQDMGVQNIWNPRENIMGGTKYLAEMLRKYNGDLNLALASYNAGPDNVNKYGGIPPFKETENYVARVKGYLNHLNGENYGYE